MTSDDDGLHSLRPTPSLELFDTVNKHYGIQIGNYVVDLGGTSSLNLLIVVEQGRYVVRVYRPSVTEARLESIHHVRHTLAAKGVPCPAIVVTLQGRPYIRLADRLVEVEHYVAHDEKMNSWERLKLGLPLLGRIHSILSTFEFNNEAHKPIYANHFELLDMLAKTIEGEQPIRSWGLLPTEMRFTDALDELVNLLYKAEQPPITHLPKQLTHGDFWDNNVLFQDGQVVLVSDIDFTSERTRIDDLALTLHASPIRLTRTGEYLISDDELRKLSELVDAYNFGLDEPLSSVERAALPLAIVRQPLWSMGKIDEASARGHFTTAAWEISLALRIAREIDRLQAAFS